MRRTSIGFVLIPLLWTCASGPATGSGSGSRDVITTAEMAETDAENTYRVIEMLRPQWLRSRGPTSVDDPTPLLPHIYVDGTFMGEVELLRSYQVQNIEEIRFLDPGRAAVRYGMGHPRGVIELIRKRSGA